MTTRTQESVCGVIGAGKGTVREHIAVEVIAYRVATERGQTVIGIIRKAAIGRVGNVACRVVGEGFGRNYSIITQLLDGSCRYSTEVIISITQFGRICKYLMKKQF